MRKEDENKKVVEFFTRDFFDQLPEQERILLRDYRNKIKWIKGREGKIKRLERELKETREGLRKWKRELTVLSGSVSHLKKEYYFNFYVVSYKKRSISYYNICLKRHGKPTKNIYLGREDKIREHMSKFYGDEKYLNKRTDWISKLTYSGNFEEVSDNILRMIREDSVGFDKRKITMEDVLPLSVRK